MERSFILILWAVEGCLRVEGGLPSQEEGEEGHLEEEGYLEKRRMEEVKGGEGWSTTTGCPKRSLMDSDSGKTTK